MLKLKPVHSAKDLNKGDLVYILNFKSYGGIARVDCIDGQTLFLVSPHENMKVKFAGGGEYGRFELGELLSSNQVIKIYEDNK